MRVILIPGWNEQAKLMRTFSEGRNGKDGLNAFGFDCTIFPDGDEPLRRRIDRFGNFLDRLHAREPSAFPVATVGYSAGALINRGFLRAYPHRANEIAATVQIAGPNAGLITNYAIGTMRLARTPTRVTICEVGPRDGLQNEAVPISTEDKIRFCDLLSDAGVPILEATSFVSPKHVPQMADAGEVFRRIRKDADRMYLVLVPNERGLDRAMEAGVRAFANASEAAVN